LPNLHWDILDQERQGIFQKLYSIIGCDYYLAGGTALALQIGHRESFDFDLFRAAPITLAVKSKIVKGLASYKPQMLVDTSDELSLVLRQEIKVTLLNYYWEPIFPLLKTPQTVPLLSIKDLATTKAYALGRRGNYRDYFDLYIIIKQKHASLGHIIKWSQKKYGEVFSEKMFLEQLTYLDDLKVETNLKYLAEAVLKPSALSNFFKKEIKKYLRGIQ